MKRASVFWPVRAFFNPFLGSRDSWSLHVWRWEVQCIEIEVHVWFSVRKTDNFWHEIILLLCLSLFCYFSSVSKVLLLVHVCRKSFRVYFWTGLRRSKVSWFYHLIWIYFYGQRFFNKIMQIWGDGNIFLILLEFVILVGWERRSL